MFNFFFVLVIIKESTFLEIKASIFFYEFVEKSCCKQSIESEPIFTV